MRIDRKQKFLFKYQKENRKKDTLAIVKIQGILNSLSIKYIREKGFSKGLNSFVLADFYLPKPYKTVIEVDGKYHQDQKSYDNFKDDYYKFRGFKVIRLINEKVLMDNFKLTL